MGDCVEKPLRSEFIGLASLYTLMDAAYYSEAYVC